MHWEKRFIRNLRASITQADLLDGFILLMQHCATLGLELPDRLAAALIDTAGVAPDRVLSELQRDERMRLIETLVRGPLPWTSDEGYKKAEVTGGGVSLAEIDPRTMESRRKPGLVLCGEVLDAFGPIGGYNFLWAWATGRAAGLGAAQRA